MASFEIPDVPLEAAVRTERDGERSVRRGTARFTVTNKAGYGVTGQATVLPEGEARKEWFTLEGEAVRQFSAASTQVYPVNFTVPGEVVAGRYGFRFRISNENDPDNDFTESPLVVLQLPAAVQPGKPKGPPWWIFVVAGAVLLLVVGVVIFFMTRGGGEDSPTRRPGGLNVAGQWTTNVGQMNLTQTGNQITGVYGAGARVTGQINGRSVTGYWMYPPGAFGSCPAPREGTTAWGRLEWTFADANNFTGSYSGCDAAPTISWTGTRTGSE